MTIKTCMDRHHVPLAAMQEALAENPLNLPDVAQFEARQNMQRLVRAVDRVRVQALPTLPVDVNMDVPTLSDSEVRTALADQLLLQLKPADRLYVKENNLVPSLIRHSLALMTAKLWQNGRVLRITFLGGHATVQSRVIEWARQWENHANLHFDFLSDNNQEADIRIAFEAGGSWSYVGTDAKLAPQGEPTMNFGWLTPASSNDTYSRVVLHEFGHAMGAIHEHQHPEGNIPWDKEAVYAYYGAPPNNWSQEQVNVNLFQTYEKDLLNYSDFDPASIMLYPISNELTEGDWEVGWNGYLSEQDKQFMGKNYPFDDSDPGVSEEPAVLTLDAPPLTSAISTPGETQAFKFTADQKGLFCYQTSGDTDVILSVFAANNSQQPLAEDDDSGEGWNAKLLVELEPGEYEIRVSHYDEDGTGAFAVWAT